MQTWKRVAARNSRTYTLVNMQMRSLHFDDDGDMTAISRELNFVWAAAELEFLLFDVLLRRHRWRKVSMTMRPTTMCFIGTQWMFILHRETKTVYSYAFAGVFFFSSINVMDQAQAIEMKSQLILMLRRSKGNEFKVDDQCNDTYTCCSERRTFFPFTRSSQKETWDEMCVRLAQAWKPFLLHSKFPSVSLLFAHRYLLYVSALENYSSSVLSDHMHRSPIRCVFDWFSFSRYEPCSVTIALRGECVCTNRFVRNEMKEKVHRRQWDRIIVFNWLLWQE